MLSAPCPWVALALPWGLAGSPKLLKGLVFTVCIPASSHYPLLSRMLLALWAPIWSAPPREAKVVIKGNKECALSSQKRAESSTTHRENKSPQPAVATHTEESSQDSVAAQLFKLTLYIS